ncbi:MAG: glutamine--fructose-6-phosphate transaminase (isomerizing) [Thermoanaerobaculum sp.]|nr:glutamine--fructose-6-phosphate transaminase (isomerizing) [Thermoanaerobaculum sp.]MDW7968087.1 glutamine--fructose-6-phosphate transaminase (isomerizing) [Thermoanaerobaculum sp.]
MCGIVGYVGQRQAVPLVLDALRRLEYRGYDSAGVAVQTPAGLAVVRAEGKLVNLLEKAYAAQLAGHVAIAHTRWATHGPPVERNAHPHTDDGQQCAVVHNGIIENFAELKAQLMASGARFASDTDSEVIAHLLARGEGSLWERACAVRRQLKGQFAVVAMDQREPGVLVALRQGPPLVVGLADGETVVASDPAAVIALTRRCIHLEDGDVACLSSQGVSILDGQDQPVQRAEIVLDWDPAQVERGGYKHFMLKEIYEQPGACAQTLQVLLPDGVFDLTRWGLSPQRLLELGAVHLVACGTSWHAALVGKFFLEGLAGIPCQVDYASEYRYRDPLLPEGTLVVGVTQSGETADTLAAMRLARERGALLASLCNVRGAMAERLAAVHLPTSAGPEIGVASTKAFSSQLVALLVLALAWRRARGAPAVELEQRLRELPYSLQETLQQAAPVQEVAQALHHARNALYLGRGVLYPVALEGALKLKEISYIHAEGYPAGEMKHGPIALLDEQFPVVGLCPAFELFHKTLSNLEEVRARQAPVYVVGDPQHPRLRELAQVVIPLPPSPWPLLPILAVVPLQLLAYHVAVLRGCDVDQPRNLAKSVTVE